MAKKADDDSPVFELTPKPHKNLSALERVERNLEIVADKAGGMTWAEVAKKHGVSDRQCRNVVSAYKQLNPSLREHDPVEIVDELLDGYVADIATLYRAQAKAEELGQLNALIGAINSKTAIRQKMTELLQAINALPHDLGLLKNVMDGRVLSQRLILVLERHNVPDAVFDELLDELGGPPPDMGVEDDPAETPALTQ